MMEHGLNTLSNLHDNGDGTYDGSTDELILFYKCSNSPFSKIRAI